MCGLVNPAVSSCYVALHVTTHHHRQGDVFYYQGGPSLHQVCQELHLYVHQLHFTSQTHSILMNVSIFLIVSKPLNFGVSIFYLFKQKLNKTLKDFYCYKYCGFIVARRLKLSVRMRFYLKQFQALH